MSNLIPFWNHAGESHLLEGYPHSFADWVSGETLAPETQSLISLVESRIGRSVTSTRCRSIGANLVLQALLDDGATVFIRQRCAGQDPSSESWSLAKFAAETNLLQWLKANSDLPIPSLHCVELRPESINSFMVQERMSGAELFNNYALLSTATKEKLVQSYAQVVLRLFRLSVPQGKIGSAASVFSSPNVFEVGPRIGLTPAGTSSKSFNSLGEYFDFLITWRKSQTLDHPLANQALRQLEKHLPVLLSVVNQPSALRSVLGHEDLHAQNILASSDGHVTGIVDWEAHCVKPAILGAEYPDWLLYDGPQDPRFASASNWWLESPAESARLCSIFEKVVEAQDPEYLEVLQLGKKLRAIVAWLIRSSEVPDDPWGRRLQSWIDAELK
ncbi:hypothetical protein C8J56DRAFT_256880 [Mycena floridula]|nr:hypothetical protein C8J56DRAFT_256880 [Mycena floridula]